ncbi:MAG TPA: ATP-binding protein [Usitatibacter sp.]|jgi:signal transduction histidine kinase/CheY-like chemotaxis protein/HPt (histidine-containing phosphotransfer) domain-containing protein|nr:ATP-binding protein [Usitatibacter sp.]
MKRIFRSVQAKLFAGVLLTTIVALLICGLGLFAYDLQAYRDKSANDLTVEAKVLGYVTAAALQFDDPASAAQNVAFLKARPNIRVAVVYTPRGTVFATYLRDGVAPSEIPRAPGVEGATIRGDTVAVFHQILSDHQLAGSIYLAEDLRLFNRIWTYAAIALAVILVALLASAALSAWLQRGITGPIIHIAALARHVVDRRDYAVRVRRTTDDEIGTLAEAFNEMLSEIQRRTDALVTSNAEIQRLNKDLEQRVIERTAELEESNLQLKTASQAKSTFLSMMSHEIRTPMNGVLGMLELLSLSDLDVHQRTTLNIVRDSGRSLLRIIDDILDFSKIEAGKLEVAPEVASVAKMVARVAAIYSGNASSKALTLKSHCDPRISPAVLVDPLRLQQILNNLVSNAIKFTQEGFVEIKAELVERREETDLVRFSVTDTGIGISGDSRAALFQPFTQGGSEVTRMFGGTGLGLSIGKRLAEMMGGAISVASELGEGTTVSVLLPLPIADPALLPADTDLGGEVTADTVLARRAAPSIEEAQAEGTLVLVVDDHPVNRLVLRRQVTALGYASEEAEDGREALEKWRSGRFPLVITDCNMPGMDGYALTRAIREAEGKSVAARSTVVIACTANALKGEAENCFAAGMNDYIAKPVQLPKLMEKLDNWLPIPSGANARGAGAVPMGTLERGTPLGDSPLDRAVLAEASGGDARLEHEILAQFRRFNTGDLLRLSTAQDSRRLEDVIQAAHRIKGASRALGAARLASICARIEAAARQGHWEAIVACRQALDAEVLRIERYIDGIIGRAAHAP